MKRFGLFLFLTLLIIVSCVFIFAQKSINNLKESVQEIGKLNFKTDIPVRYLTKKKLKKYVEDLFEKEYSDELAAKESLYIYLMGFTNNPEINIKKERKKIIVDHAGGLYNEQKGELYSLEEYREIDFMNGMIIVHELRHAVQDQHFNLSSLLEGRPESDFDDRKLALLGAVEGDATLVMVKYSDFDPGLLDTGFGGDSWLTFMPSGNSTAMIKGPDILKYQFIMPYIEGLKFITYIHSKKKWKGVNLVLKNPPLSSEQLIHPQKYLKKEQPVIVEISYEPQGISRVHSGVVGEYYLNILMKKKGKYVDVAGGWGGDRFEVFKSGESMLLIWESEWDKEEICSRFYYDYKRFIEDKFKVNFKKGTRQGQEFVAGKSNDGYFFVSKLKKKMFYVRTNDRNQINKLISGGNYD